MKQAAKGKKKPATKAATPAKKTAAPAKKKPAPAKKKPAPAKKKPARRVPAALAAYFAGARWKSIDDKTPPFIPMFSAESNLRLVAVREATDDVGDREDVLERHPTLWPLAWVECEGTIEDTFVAIDGSSPACPVVLWWPENGDLVPMADSLDAYVAQLASPVAKAKRATLDQLKAAYRSADKLSDDNKNEAALAILDKVLAGYDFAPKVEMMLADDLIEWVGGCYRMRGTVAVLGPPYARATALADSERDFRSAITWLSLGLSSPGYAYIGLCETLVYEARDLARGIAEADRALAGRLEYDKKHASYARFHIIKAKAFAQLASNQVAAAEATFADAVERARDDGRFRERLIEDLDRLDKDYPKHVAVTKKVRARLAA